MQISALPTVIPDAIDDAAALRGWLGEPIYRGTLTEVRDRIFGSDTTVTSTVEGGALGSLEVSGLDGSLSQARQAAKMIVRSMTAAGAEDALVAVMRLPSGAHVPLQVDPISDLVDVDNGRVKSRTLVIEPAMSALSLLVGPSYEFDLREGAKVDASATVPPAGAE